MTRNAAKARRSAALDHDQGGASKALIVIFSSIIGRGAPSHGAEGASARPLTFMKIYAESCFINVSGFRVHHLGQDRPGERRGGAHRHRPHRGQQRVDALVVDIGAHERARADRVAVRDKASRPPMTSSAPGRMLVLAPSHRFIE